MANSLQKRESTKPYKTSKIFNSNELEDSSKEDFLAGSLGSRDLVARSTLIHVKEYVDKYIYFQSCLTQDTCKALARVYPLPDIPA